MKPIILKFKNTPLFLYLLLAIGLLIRIYASFSVPLIGDEEIFIQEAHKLTFSIANISKIFIPNINTQHPHLPIFIAKIALNIFNNTTWVRIVFSFIATLGILFIYKTLLLTNNSRIAILSTLLLITSEAHIGFSRFTLEMSCLLFFSACIIYYFFKGVLTQKKSWWIFTGSFLGVSFLNHELTALFLPTFFIYLAFNKKYRFILKEKNFYNFCLLFFLIITPYLIWHIFNTSNNLYVARKVSLSPRRAIYTRSILLNRHSCKPWSCRASPDTYVLIFYRLCHNLSKLIVYQIINWC